ncbi:HPr family phosphocarrier protein [Methylobrevis albus]
MPDGSAPDGSRIRPEGAPLAGAPALASGGQSIEDSMPTEDTLSGAATLANQAGLHARPAVKLTQLAKSFASRTEFAVAPDGPWIDAKSPVKVMRVKAAKGETLHFRASGPDAEAALAALLALVDAKFDEE